MLLHAHSLSGLAKPVEERLVLDHFETFEFSQDFPFGVATVVGADSWFVYALDPAPHMRSGRTTVWQKKRLRERPARRLHGHYEGSVRRVLDALLNLQPRQRVLSLVSDGHAAYRRALRAHPKRSRFALSQFRNPDPRAATDRDVKREAKARNQAMFPVDLLHKLFRHSLAHHRRETIAFTRRINAAMERLALTLVWRNFVKRRSERRTASRSPAMHLGMTRKRWSWERVFARRLFFRHVRLAKPWGELYRRWWKTPVYSTNTIHGLVNAF